MKNGRDNPLERFNRPLPPADLRERTLDAASSAMSRPVQADYWRELWESVWLRVAWSAGVTALLVCHVVISDEKIASHQDASMLLALTATDPEDELFEVVGLSRIDDSLPSLVSLRPEAVEIGGGEKKGDAS